MNSLGCEKGEVLVEAQPAARCKPAIAAKEKAIHQSELCCVRGRGRSCKGAAADCQRRERILCPQGDTTNHHITCFLLQHCRAVTPHLESNFVTGEKLAEILFV